MYSEGTISSASTLLSSLRAYLQGVTLGRLSINRSIASIVADGHDVLIDIGGSRLLRDHIRNGYHVILDIEHRQENTVTADARIMPFRSDSIDCVLCISVLEHSSDPFAILLECCRVLKIGGVLFVSTPWMFESHMEPHDYWRFSPWQLERWFAEIGLKVVRAEPTNDYWGLLAHFLQKLWYARPTLGLAAAIAHHVGNSKSSRYATQFNYWLTK